MFDLTGRTALVTGATGGIGGAIAQALHAQGATVAISGTRREVLDTLAGKLGDRVHVLPCNLSDAAEVEALVPSAEKAMGQVDILIANAGITRDNLFVQLRDEDWDEVIKVNLTATFRLARAGDQIDDAQALRPHHCDHLGCRRHRQSGPGQLHRVEGRTDRHDQDAGRRIRQAQRHRQLHRPGIYCDADDRRAQRQATRNHPFESSCGPAWNARRYRGGGGVSQFERSGAMSPGRRFTSMAGWP